MTSPYCGIKTATTNFCGLPRGHEGPHYPSQRTYTQSDLNAALALRTQEAAGRAEELAQAALGVMYKEGSFYERIIALIKVDESAALVGLRGTVGEKQS